MAGEDMPPFAARASSRHRPRRLLLRGLPAVEHLPGGERPSRVGLHGTGRYYQHARQGLARPRDGGRRCASSRRPACAADRSRAGARRVAPQGQEPALERCQADARERLRRRHRRSASRSGRTPRRVRPGFRGGKDYFFRDLGASVNPPRGARRRPSPEGRSHRRPAGLGGRGGARLVRGAELPRQRRRVPHVRPGDRRGARCAARRRRRARRTQQEIEVSVQTARGWDASSYHEATASDVLPVLLPWDGVKSQTFRFDGARFQQGRRGRAARHPPRESSRACRPRRDHRGRCPGADRRCAASTRCRRDHGLRLDLPSRTEEPPAISTAMAGRSTSPSSSETSSSRVRRSAAGVPTAR